MSIEKLDVNDLRCILSHVTTSIDKMESIEKYGLMNLQDTLTFDTCLKSYLAEFDIHFDIENKLLYYQGQSYCVANKEDGSTSVSDMDSLHGRLQGIVCRLYKDHQISAFFCMSSDTDYAGEVHKRPEFLSNLADLAEECRVEEDWINRAEPYVIEFIVGVNELEWFTFDCYKNKDQYFNDEVKVGIKNCLIDMAIYMLWDDYHNNERDERYAFLKPWHVVLPQDMMCIRRIAM